MYFFALVILWLFVFSTSSSLNSGIEMEAADLWHVGCESNREWLSDLYFTLVSKRFYSSYIPYPSPPPRLAQ